MRNAVERTHSNSPSTINTSLLNCKSRKLRDSYNPKMGLQKRTLFCVSSYNMTILI